MNEPVKRILVVEDERAISDLVTLHLEDSGFVVEVCHDGLNGLRKACGGGFDLLLLDLMVPGATGLEICQKVQSLSPRPLVMILTSRSEEYDRVLGLELGADDYLTKPFSVRELIARVRALFRRRELPGGAARTLFTVGPLSIDTDRRKVHLEGNEVPLTATEFDLLAYLAKHSGKAFSREQLLNAVWGYTYAGYEHTVNSHVNRLRSKIETDPANPRFIETVRGVGYRCAEAA